MNAFEKKGARERFFIFWYSPSLQKVLRNTISRPANELKVSSVNKWTAEQAKAVGKVYLGAVRRM